MSLLIYRVLKTGPFSGFHCNVVILLLLLLDGIHGYDFV